MKIKLMNLINAFGPITEVYDSIEKFSRKWELVEPYKEIKEAVTLFENERKEIVPQTNNEGNVPVKQFAEFEKKVSAMLDAEIELKKPIRFTINEVEDSKIKGSQLSLITEFIQK